MRFESLETRVPPTRAVVPSSPVRVYTRVMRMGILCSSWKTWPCHQGAHDDAIVGGIRLSILPTVVYRGKIGRRHLLPELFEARRIVVLYPWHRQKKFPIAVQVCQGAGLVLAQRLTEMLPQCPHVPSLLHK